MKTIVVGTDGSESSLLAVAQAAEIAAKFGARLHVTYVMSLATDIPFGMAGSMPLPEGFAEQATAAANDVVTRAAEVAKAAGATTETHVCQGEASHALVDLCEELSADLLVVGSRGMTGAARFLLGSVPNRCAHHAHCSVLIARTN